MISACGLQAVASATEVPPPPPSAPLPAATSSAGIFGGTFGSAGAPASATSTALPGFPGLTVPGAGSGPAGSTGSSTTGSSATVFHPPGAPGPSAATGLPAPTAGTQSGAAPPGSQGNDPASPAVGAAVDAGPGTGQPPPMTQSQSRGRGNGALVGGSIAAACAVLAALAVTLALLRRQRRRRQLDDAPVVHSNALHDSHTQRDSAIDDGVMLELASHRTRSSRGRKTGSTGTNSLPRTHNNDAYRSAPGHTARSGSSTGGDTCEAAPTPSAYTSAWSTTGASSKRAATYTRRVRCAGATGVRAAEHGASAATSSVCGPLCAAGRARSRRAGGGKLCARHRREFYAVCNQVRCFFCSLCLRLSRAHVRLSTSVNAVHAIKVTAQRHQPQQAATSRSAELKPSSCPPASPPRRIWTQHWRHPAAASQSQLRATAMVTLARCCRFFNEAQEFEDGAHAVPRARSATGAP